MQKKKSAKKTKGVKKKMSKSCKKSCSKKCDKSSDRVEKTTGDFHQAFPSSKDFKPQESSLWSKIKRMLGL